MILTRRRFLQVASSTLFVAPAIVRAESLMKIWVPDEKEIVVKALAPDEMTLPDLRRLNDYTLAKHPTESTVDAAASRKDWANAAGFRLNEKIEGEILKAYEYALIHGSGALKVSLI